MIVMHASYLAEQGHDVVIAASRVDTVFSVSDHVKIEQLSAGSKFGTVLNAAISLHDVDCVVADIIPMICLLMIRNHKKLVYFAQDYDESYYDNNFMKLLIRRMYFIALRIVKVPVIAVSSELTKKLRSLFSANAVVVENGVDDKQFFPDPSEKLVTEKKKRKAVLVLSRRDLRKGFDIAVDVVCRAYGKYPEFVVWSVGEKTSGVFGNIPHHDFGYVGENELRQVMSSADILLYPSRHEGFPLMVLEAFACGLPVVTTEAVPFACNGENALVSQIGDIDSLTEMLLEILMINELRNKLAGFAAIFAKEHSLQKSSAVFESYLVSRFNDSGHEC